MNCISVLRAAAAALLIAGPALADSHQPIQIDGAYARASSPNAKAGAIYMVVTNTSGEDDRLIEARSDAAMMTEIHTTVMSSEGVMQMVHLEDGIAIPAGETHEFARGADHVMLMGLMQDLTQPGEVALTLVFEKVGEIEVTVPVAVSESVPAGN